MHGWYFWLVGFSLTLLLEAPLVLWLLPRADGPFWRRISWFAFANLVTHPLVWFFFPLLPLSRAASIGLSEFWAFGAEAVFYWMVSQRLSLGRAAGISLVANLTSFSIGWVLVTRFQPWLFPS